MIWLAAGDARTYHTRFTVLSSSDAVAAAAAAIESTQRQPAQDVPQAVS
jgi:hypothetical protein